MRNREDSRITKKEGENNSDLNLRVLLSVFMFFDDEKRQKPSSITECFHIFSRISENRRKNEKNMVFRNLEK